MKFVGVFKCNSACGHWDGLGGPYKYHPTVGIKKFKRLLQHHFDVITVKEWNTSSICPSCNGKVRGMGKRSEDFFGVRIVKSTGLAIIWELGIFYGMPTIELRMAPMILNSR